MFSSVGWGEILLLVVVGLVVVGPERLPHLIQDARAALLAARTAINNAKQTLDSDFGSEFDEIRKPLSQVAQYSRMSPKSVITKALFDDDAEFLNDFDPKKIMAEGTEGEAQRKNQAPENNANVVERPKENGPKDGPNYSGGVSWTDII